MRISIAQMNSAIGAFDQNRERILDFARRARQEGAELVLFPELALCGYPPMDLLDQDRFVELNQRTLHILQKELPPDIAVGLGYVGRNPSPGGKALVNAYGFIVQGALAFEQIKTLLPTYDVFDEARNFEAAQSWPVFEWKGARIGAAICEDVWRETAAPGTRYVKDPVQAILDQGVDLLCVPSASPYYAGKFAVRKALAERISFRGDVPLAYINAVGANDSIIFDGRSFILTPGGCVIARAFQEDLVTWDTGEPAGLGSASKANGDDELDTLEQALVLGIQEYMKKCGFTRAHLGLSGGIDSALVACLAVQAIGKDQVSCFSMPSRFSSQGSLEDAAALAANLGCAYDVLPIEPVYSAFLGSLEKVFEDRPFDLAEENLQARIRGTLMMAYSNKFGSMLLATGNKSELAMGYCTLYGDMAGALAPIGDLFKTEVFALCRRINQRTAASGGLIPQATLTKPPSAELRPNQTDQDSLPPYETLDEILKLYLFENLSKDEIARRGWDAALAERIIRTVARAEFKRRQAPPVLKVSPRAFGMGRRMPIARHIHEL